MAPLPPSSTPRFRFDYTVNGEAHDFQIRSGASPSAVGTLVDTFLEAIGPSFYLITIVSASFAADGSNIFLPVTTGIEGHTYGSGAGVYEQKAWYADFIGRTAAGRRWRLAIFGTRTLGTDFRFLTGENADLVDGIAALNGAAGDLVGIDDTAVTVYTYVNAGVNSHWQRALRP